MKIEEITKLLSREHFNSHQQIKDVISLLKDVYVVPSLIMAQGNLVYRARPINNLGEICDTSSLSYTPSDKNKFYKRMINNHKA